MRLPAGVRESEVVERLDRFRIETPSWGYADTGTRFGKYIQPAAATTIEEKLADAAQVHLLTGCCPTVAVHALWDFADGPSPEGVRGLAESLGLRIGSINPNVFQDQCYKWGSVTNEDSAIRERAIAHMLDCVRIGRIVGSKVLSLWFADGTNYPGQGHFRRRKKWMEEALSRVHRSMPDGMRMMVEYKPFEPAFYHTDVADWGMACGLARKAGERAMVLVDTGHHLQGCNIEHIVAWLIDEDMLGGFHFNDRKYADDDLTMGSMDPYQLFRIFAEIVQAERERGTDLAIEYMVDQSHNLKPKVEAMIQTAMTAQEFFIKAMLVDFDAVDQARSRGDVVAAENAMRDAFAQDVREFLRAYRMLRGLPADPLKAHQESGYEAKAALERGPRKGTASGSYA